MMNADGTDSCVVARVARATFDRLDFSPDGGKLWIAYALWPPFEPPPTPTRPGEIWTMRADGTDQRRIFTLPRDLLSSTLSWQPRP
jgi:hypothetical protein